MKHLIKLYGTLLICCTLTGSCAQKENSYLADFLHQADSLARIDGPAIQARLDSMGMPKDKYLHALWCLAYCSTIDQQHTPQSDSLIDIAYNYLTDHGTPSEQYRVTNVKGSVYYNRKERDKATEYFLKGLDMAEKMNDPKSLMQSHSYLGSTYIYHENLSRQAIKEYAKCLEIAVALKDSLWLGIANLCMGRPYLTAVSTDSLYTRWEEGVHYYKEGIKFSKLQNDEWTYVAALNELAALYSIHRHPTEALECLKESKPIHLRVQPTYTMSLYMTLADAYFAANQIDSALHYTRLLLTDDNYKRNGFVRLYNYYANKHDFEKAVFYNDSVYHYDLIFHRKDLTTQVVAIQEKYNQEKAINEKNRMEMERDQAILNGLLAAIVLLIAIAFLIYIYQRKLNLKKEELRRNALRLHENEEQILSNEQFIAELQKQITAEQENHEQSEEELAAIAAMQQQNEALHSENLRLKKHIDSYKHQLKPQELEALKAQSERVRQLEEREKALANELAENNELICLLRKTPKFIQTTEWETLRCVTNKVYNRFCERLMAQFPNLTEVDVQFCILIKLRFTVSQIAILTAISPTSVSQQKSRMKKRILQTDEDAFNKGQTLDMWIWEY
ncbi:hypothetical protein [Phocaeicola sp.]